MPALGFFDSIKKATGLGLNAEEHYSRVWEQSVLLGPSKYGEAVELFKSAATKADEAGDRGLAQRARANAHLYGFIATGKGGHLLKVREHLAGLEHIEQVGSRNEAMSAPDLVSEIDAREIEAQVSAVAESDHSARATAHAAAAASFKRIFPNALLTYRFHSPDEHTPTAQSRYFLHEGLSAWHRANVLAPSDPEGASGELSRAMQFFTQVPDDAWSQRASMWSVRLKKRRPCWICQREFQGEDLHFGSVSADISAYAVTVLAGLPEGTHAADHGAQSVVLCAPCASVVRRMADTIAQGRTQELRQEVAKTVAEMTRAIVELQGTVRSISARIPLSGLRR